MWASSEAVPAVLSGRSGRLGAGQVPGAAVRPHYGACRVVLALTLDGCDTVGHHVSEPVH